MKLAVAAYDVSPSSRPIEAWIAEAAAEGADVLLLPEYAALDWTNATGDDAAIICTAAARAFPAFTEMLRDLATRHGVWIIGASGPAKATGELVNRALIVAPDGTVHTQDKLILTPWERANTPLSPGRGLTLFDLPWGRAAVLVCYDSEFPLLARRATQAGAKLLLIPACTDAPQGATRVRNAARARAQEGVCLTAVSPLVGDLPDNPMIDRNTGRAGVYTPPDAGFPPDGILIEGAVDAPGWIYADLPPASALRGHEVDIAAHWPESATLGPAFDA